jgi:hypothetical protein
MKTYSSMDIDKLRSEAAFANGQADGHQQPPLPNWVVIGELIQERDSLLAVARAAKNIGEHGYSCRLIIDGDIPYSSRDDMKHPACDCGCKELYEALENLPASVKAELGLV